MALIITVVWLAIPKSTNAVACNSYARAYNSLAAAVRLNIGAENIRAIANGLPQDIGAAARTAGGDVLAAMVQSGILSVNILNARDDGGTAFFLSAIQVADACKADGAPITLNALK